MSARPDPDLPSVPPAADPAELRAASHLHMAAHLTGPLRPGAGDRELVVTAAGGAAEAACPAGLLRPLVVAAPRRPLGFGEAWELTAAAAGGAAVTVRWEPFTDAGTCLPLGVVAADPVTGAGAAAKFTLTLTRTGGPEPGAVAADRVAAAVTVRAVEGNLGRLLYVLGAEQARLRRVAAEVEAGRCLGTAAGPTLDRHGADLGVARLTERLAWDAGTGTIGTAAILGGEADADYRRRLALYRPFRMGGPGDVRRLLNGPGTGGVNTGPLAGTGVTGRFEVVEQDDPFATAIHLVAFGGAARADFLAAVRRTVLVRPLPEGNIDHRTRPQSAEGRTADTRTRATLRLGWRHPPAAGYAPALAQVLGPAGLVLAAAGLPTARRVVTRAQDDAGGSRFELGLGAEVEAPTAAEWDGVKAALAGGVAANAAGAALAARLRPVAAAAPGGAADPDGAWFWAACGVRTVVRTAAARLYLSHLPVWELVVTAAANPAGQPVLTAAWPPPGGGDRHALLADALAAGLAEWRDAGGPEPTLLTTAERDAAVAAALAVTPPGVNVGLTLAGLPGLSDEHPVGPQRGTVATALWAGVQLPPAIADPLRGADAAGRATAAAALRRLVAAFARHGVSAALAFPTDPDGVVLAVGVGSFPVAGTNLAAGRAAGFRWYLAPLAGDPAGFALHPTGPTARVVGPAGGLAAVMAVGYARRGGADPYEYRVEPAAGAAPLTLPQYEFLMNLVQVAAPVGVEINTFPVRRGGVDPDGDGAADPLTPAAARTFRPYRTPPRRRDDVPPPAPAD
jgi:hypothetical protein